MAFNISYIFQAIDKFTGPARQIIASTQKMKVKFEGLNKVVKFGTQLQHKSMIGMLVAQGAMLGIGTAIIHTAGTFQKLNMSFHAMMDNQQDATDLFKKMIEMSQKFGAGTTVEFADAARSLLAVGGSAKKIPIVLNRIADITSLTGLSLEGVAKKYAIAFATGKVQRVYIRHLMNSTNLLQIMANVMKVTKGEASTMLSGAKIPFSVLAEAIKRMTSVGGKYFEGQKKGAHTIFGAYNAIKDAIQVLMKNAGMFLVQQFDLINVGLKLRDNIMGLNKNFGFYAHKYGHLVKMIIIGLAAFTALLTVNFVLGTLLRSVTLIIMGYRIAVIAVRAAVIAWRLTLLAFTVIAWASVAPFLIFTVVLAAVIIGILLLLRHLHLLKGTMFTLGKAVTEYIIEPFDKFIDKAELAIKAIQKFAKVAASIGKKAEAPFAAVGHWIAKKIPVPTHLYDTERAIRMTTQTALPSIYQIGAPAGARLTAAQGGVPSGGGVSYHEAIVAAFKEAFPNLNEGLKTKVNINIDGKHAGGAEHSAHAGSYPNSDVGLTMPQAGGNMA